MSKTNVKNYLKEKTGSTIKEVVVSLFIGMALDGLRVLVEKNKTA